LPADTEDPVELRRRGW